MVIQHTVFFEIPFIDAGADYGTIRDGYGGKCGSGIREWLLDADPVVRTVLFWPND